jgi:hypothetical protein
MGMALAAIAEDSDFFVLDQVHIAIAIIIDAHGVPPLMSGGRIRTLKKIAVQNLNDLQIIGNINS